MKNKISILIGISSFLLFLSYSQTAFALSCNIINSQDSCPKNPPYTCVGGTLNKAGNTMGGNCVPATQTTGCKGLKDTTTCKNGLACLASIPPAAGGKVVGPAYTCQLPGGNGCLTKGKPDNSKCKNGTTCQKNPFEPSTYACELPQGVQGSACDPSKNECKSGLSCVSQNGLDSGLVGLCEAPVPTVSSFPPPPSPPCEQWANGQCTTFDTGLGAFSTDPEGFIQNIFAILLSLSGGVALLLIIRAGYQLMISQGKPEQIQQGRDQLIAAIVGLVFLIFSFVFLQLIGFDILHIPGFNGASTGGGGTCQPGSCIQTSLCTTKDPGHCNTNGCPGGQSCVQQ